MTETLLKFRNVAIFGCMLEGFIASTSFAHADCVSGPSFGASYHGETIERRIETEAGGCRLTFNTDQRLIDMITSVEFLSKPTHGIAQIKDFSVGYWAVKGYQGEDAFSVKVCGKKGGGDGCMTIVEKYVMTKPSSQDVTEAMVKSRLNGATIQ
jgi:hypothetical protein